MHIVPGYYHGEEFSLGKYRKSQDVVVNMVCAGQHINEGTIFFFLSPPFALTPISPQLLFGGLVLKDWHSLAHFCQAALGCSSPRKPLRTPHPLTALCPWPGSRLVPPWALMVLLLFPLYICILHKIPCDFGKILYTFQYAYHLLTCNRAVETPFAQSEIQSLCSLNKCLTTWIHYCSLYSHTLWFIFLFYHYINSTIVKEGEKFHV